ncbi:hypothetical protein [Oscillatoria acuminata]|uniref:Uncharacterized protein n=1 Tax=Oscillatoria acuminata PCC 6304 TaxID=56110 RepID=K9TC40_9CYAN|nr:hypothetical protein [Oscillatoria acuminata]AFY80105.1 hypothetical protein Oscil6304_0354 [Oscillatoria acuminata PCC 6304]
MNTNNPNQGNNHSHQPRSPENIAQEVEKDQAYYDLYEDEEEDLLPYPPGEAYDAYCENPTYNNAIEAAEEIWGIPDPRLIGLD